VVGCGGGVGVGGCTLCGVGLCGTWCVLVYLDMLMLGVFVGCYVWGVYKLCVCVLYISAF